MVRLGLGRTELADQQGGLVDLAVGGLSRTDHHGWLLWGLYLFLWLAQILARSVTWIDTPLVSCWGWLSCHSSSANNWSPVTGWISTDRPWLAALGKWLGVALHAGCQVTERASQLGRCPQGDLGKWHFPPQPQFPLSFFLSSSLLLLLTFFLLPSHLPSNECQVGTHFCDGKQKAEPSFSLYTGWQLWGTEQGDSSVPDAGERGGRGGLSWHLTLISSSCHQLGKRTRSGPLGRATGAWGGQAGKGWAVDSGGAWMPG